MSELAKWYAEQCNGDWEHTYGIRIETLDNPGWWVVVDLGETPYSDLRVKGKSDTEWMGWESHQSDDGPKLHGYCGPEDLDTLLSKLASLLRSATPPNEQS